MSVSHWQLGGGPLRSAEAIVIGGGIAGVSVGLELLGRGIEPLVLDMRRVASGASGRNAGYLMRGAADNYAAAVRDWGRERARALWKLTEDNLALLRARGAESIPGYHRIPSCLVALEPGEAEEIQRSRALMLEDGFEVGGLDDLPPDDLLNRGVALAGLVNPNDAACHPVELLRHLMSILGDRCIEHAEVAAITDAPGGRLRLDTSTGPFECAHLFVCTNAWTDRVLPALARNAPLVMPRRGQMFASDHAGVALSASYYMNHGSEYVRVSADGALLVGGCRTQHAEAEVGYDDHPTGPVQRDLERFAAELLGIEPVVSRRWAGIMGFGPGGLPAVDAVGRRMGFARDESVTVCAGFTGHGMSMAARCAQLAVARALDHEPTGFALEAIRNAADQSASDQSR